MIDNARRSVPEWEADKTRVEELESLYAEGADVDPLIAKGLGVPLSSKDEALFMLDGRHRLIAAVAAGAGELPVYVVVRTRFVPSHPDQAVRAVISARSCGWPRSSRQRRSERCLARSSYPTSENGRGTNRVRSYVVMPA